jgi:hypothetical protein
MPDHAPQCWCGIIERKGCSEIGMALGRVVDGLAVVEAIEATPANGETPTSRVELVRVRVERRQ